MLLARARVGVSRLWGAHERHDLHHAKARVAPFAPRGHTPHRCSCRDGGRGHHSRHRGLRAGRRAGSGGGLQRGVTAAGCRGGRRCVADYRARSNTGRHQRPDATGHRGGAGRWRCLGAALVPPVRRTSPEPALRACHRDAARPLCGGVSAADGGGARSGRGGRRRRLLGEVLPPRRSHRGGHDAGRRPLGPASQRWRLAVAQPAVARFRHRGAGARRPLPDVGLLGLAGGRHPSRGRRHGVECAQRRHR
ncbi:unannotated protein [freshwater metagenome]|uniref:Unannotated protein n=1 Tax=freshwater metagenome TaxID=449393 RepID=A0A6J7KLF2_9ZZZZ